MVLRILNKRGGENTPGYWQNKTLVFICDFLSACSASERSVVLTGTSCFPERVCQLLQACVLQNSR